MAAGCVTFEQSTVREGVIAYMMGFQDDASYGGNARNVYDPVVGPVRGSNGSRNITG
jgi:hypothetical protein